MRHAALWALLSSMCAACAPSPVFVHARDTVARVQPIVTELQSNVMSGPRAFTRPDVQTTVTTQDPRWVDVRTASRESGYWLREAERAVDVLEEDDGALSGWQLAAGCMATALERVRTAIGALGLSTAAEVDQTIEDLRAISTQVCAPRRPAR